jgi:hypothetical protein
MLPYKPLQVHSYSLKLLKQTEIAHNAKNSASPYSKNAEVVEIQDDILDRYHQLTAKLSTNPVVTTNIFFLVSPIVSTISTR